MKALKWSLRYAFLGLILAGCVLFSTYCYMVAGNISADMGDISFIDIAARSISEAGSIIERRDTFNSLGLSGIIAGIIVLVLIAAMIVYQVKEEKIIAYFKNRPKKEKAPKKEHTEQAVQPAPAPQPATPAAEQKPMGVVSKTRTVSFCPACGYAHDGDVSFCAKCGTKIE